MSDTDEEQLPPPRKGDVIFGAGEEHSMANACLNYTSSDYGYRQGYRRAGQLLADYVCKECREQDLLVFPIVHNYRHHIELTLKHLVGLGSYLVDHKLTAEIRGLLLRSHDLKQLWGTLKPILFAVGKSVRWKPERADIAGVESYINQLHVVDKGSFSFRYPTDTTGAPSLPGMKYLNIYQFASHMERLAEYLDTIAFGFSIEEDKKGEYAAYEAEMQAEYDAEMRSYEQSYDEGYHYE
jgi:hypothetical protein